jgi:hypothetical protein
VNAPFIPLVAILSQVPAAPGPLTEASLPPIADVEVPAPHVESVSAAPLTRAEVHDGPRSTQVLAFDAENQVAAEIVVRIVGEGHIRIDAIFPDDIHAMAVVNGKGEILEIDNEAHELVATRIAAVLDLLAETEQAGWFPCAFHSTMAVVELAHANPLALASTVLAACECLPLLVDEFEGMECPLF